MDGTAKDSEDLMLAEVLDVNDAVLAKAVRECAVEVGEAAQKLPDEKLRLVTLAAAFILVHSAEEANAARYSMTLKGLTEGEREQGDWRVTIERLDADAA